jgi:hypothetical protein
MRGWTSFYRGHNSSNAMQYNIATSPWEEHLVTYYTKPSIDTTLEITRPTTPTIGYHPNALCWDTLELKPFFDYWQANPDMNYGFEIALQNYSETDPASRGYKQPYKNQHYIKFEFSVKPPAHVTFDELSGLGKIEVTAPEGAQLPYKYILSYEPLPSLAEIWTVIKDSIPDPAILDSLTFFRGDVNSTSFTYEDLDPERYYVNIYANDGEKIAEYEALVSADVSLLEFEDVELDKRVLQLANGSSYGVATLDGELPKDKSGGIEFEITTLEDVSIGFNKLFDPIANSELDLEYGIHLLSNGTYEFVTSDTVLVDTSFVDSVKVNDKFRITKSNYDFVIHKNEFEMFRVPMAMELADDYKVDAVFKGPAQLEGIIMLDYYHSILRPIKTKVNHAECGLHNGYIKPLWIIFQVRLYIMELLRIANLEMEFNYQQAATQ